MKLFRGLPDSTQRVPSVLTIGKFDGVHRGHQALLSRVCEKAGEMGAAATVLTFEPHPRDFFAQREHGDTVRARWAVPRVANLHDTLEALAGAGIGRVIVHPFDAHFAAIRAEQFIHDILVRGLEVRSILVGHDFCFGAGRNGDLAMLIRAGKRHGFDVHAIDPIMQGSVRISSSGVREALAHADFPLARELLGRSYAVSGRLAPLDTCDARYGFPELEFIGLERSALPAGIYSVYLHTQAALAVAATIRVKHDAKAGASARPRVCLTALTRESWPAHLSTRERVRVEFVSLLNKETALLPQHLRAGVVA
ncbi:adenylyltransferase/cytidyltransferase family protein [Caballeronia sp. DA-9]|uniref:adenylyltransferase/cytidyltransferase family protein n=1 Tax=Caballeronia sp. DA-9 TaxID=3436237 RepID=UPI003F6663BC